jgi:hypothetical protein
MKQLSHYLTNSSAVHYKILGFRPNGVQNPNHMEGKKGKQERKKIQH